MHVLHEGGVRGCMGASGLPSCCGNVQEEGGNVAFPTGETRELGLSRSDNKQLFTLLLYESDIFIYIFMKPS